MQLLQKFLHVLCCHLHHIGIEAIKPKHALHARGRRLEILPKFVLHDVPRLFGILVPHHHVSTGPRFLGEQHERSGLPPRPFAIFAMHIHEEVSELRQHEGFGKDVVVLILLFAIVLVGSARVDGGNDPPAASAAGRGRSASRGIDVRVPKMSQPRNGIPVHEISGRGHDVALERHRKPNAGAQSRGARHVSAVHQVGEVAALHAAFRGGGAGAVGVERIERHIERFDHFLVLAIFLAEQLIAVVLPGVGIPATAHGCGGAFEERRHGIRHVTCREE
mmetsp:Transcript_14130/g.22504  ORF Transcript_14130/g.22504 Transcript_14130/m.22504 type:complete len:277 (-) Transcript_14130:189-1019(-)